VKISIREEATDVLLGSVEVSDMAPRCATYPSLYPEDPGMRVSTSAACIRLRNGTTYRIVLEPLAPSIRFGVRGGDGYLPGRLERVDATGYVATHGDLLFRTFVED
jgi:hypothetical protein